MSLVSVETHASFGGTLTVYDHQSHACNCTMRFAIYEPPQAKVGSVPVLWYLSGLTCNWSNVMEKGGIERAAAEHGIMVVAPDTSPRGEGVADDDAYDLGQGAGFYINAMREPWGDHFQMETYLVEELPQIVRENFHMADLERQGITGHSMGGHGALTLHLKHPQRYRSVSAFAPIVAPSQVPWGQKAFSSYLRDDRAAWRAHDATELVKRQPTDAHILLDQGTADGFLDEQLRTHLFEAACREAGQKATIRMQEGYDHSYYFISSFMDEHMAHHAATLK